MKEGGEETPPRQGGLRWPGEDFPPPEGAPSWGLMLFLPSVVLGPRFKGSPPLLQQGQGSSGMVQPRGGSGTRCQGSSWAPGADLACETSPCPPDPRVLPGAPAGTQHPELVTDTALSPWRSQVLLPKDGPPCQGLPVSTVQQQDDATGWPVRTNPHADETCAHCRKGVTAAAAASLQACPTPCDPTDGSRGFSRQEHWSGLPFPSPMQESEMGK